jgi:molybdate transport system substrate-binding protein
MSSPSTINIMATAAFKEAYLELVPQFERATGHKVVTTWASSVDVIQRVNAGEITDMIVMAGDAIDKLIASGKLAKGSRTDIAESWVAAAVKQGAPKPDISSGDALKRALLAAKSIAYSTGPSGVYLIGLFERMGISKDIAAKVKQIKGQPVGAVVARGEAEIGFQQMSELMPVPGIDILGGLSKDIEQITRFATGVHAQTQVADACHALTQFFKSPAAHALIRAKGMEPV